MSGDTSKAERINPVSGIKYSDRSVFLIGEGKDVLMGFATERDFTFVEEKLGNVCWMEVRFHLTKPCRDCEAEVWIELEHPRIEEVRDEIRRCLRTAAVTTAITSLALIISGASGAIPSAAVATFKGVLVECLRNAGVQFAREISVTIELRNESCERWTSNCEPCD